MSEWKETTIGTIPKDWKLIEAENYCVRVTDGTHDTPKQTTEGPLLITSKHIVGGRIDLESAYHISKEDFGEINKRSAVTKWDIIISMIGTVGEVVLVDKDEIDFAIKNVGLFVCNNELQGKWLKYYLKTPQARHYLKARLSGTTQKYITLGELRDFLIPTPKNSYEQEIIVGVLSSLDDKIELLRKQNETLEAMASALFSHWFVDFEFPNENGKPYKSSGGAMIDSELGEIPEGWKVGKYGEIAKLTMGLSPKGEFYNTDSEGLPLLNGASDFEGSKIKATKYTSEITRKCERGDIIFCIRATIGNIAIADKEYCLGRGVAAIRPNEDCFFYALYFLKMTLDRLAHSATGSVIKGLSKPDISGMRILKPKKEISRFFNSTINPVFEKLKTNTSEIDTLTRLRDLLLPKLMSGEIRVEGEA